MTKEQLREFFTTWRLAKAQVEENYLLTAIAIGQYIDSVNSIATIKQNLVDANSPCYSDFENYGKKRSMGALLYGKLVTQVYLNDLADKESAEGKLIQDLTQTLGNFYEAPLVNAQINLNKLITNVDTWLNDHASNNPKKSQELCRALYTVLKIAEIKLDNLSRFERATANTKIDVAAVKKKLSDLLTATENKASELSAMLATPVDPSVPKTIGEYLNREVTALLNSNASSTNKLAALEQKLEQLKTHTASLITARQQQNIIEAEIKAVADLLQTAAANDQKIIGRGYFLELIKQHPKGYQILIATKEGETLAQKTASLEAPSPWQQFSSSVQYGVSTITSVTTVLYRAVTPQNIQDTVADYAFSTADSECKTELKILAKNHLDYLTQKLPAAKEQVAKASTILANEQASLITLVTKTSTAELETFRDATVAAQKAILEYKSLMTLVSDKQTKLNNIRGLDAKVDAFIEEHNGFFVRLSNFLSKISSIFKTEAAFMLDEVYQVKEGLLELERIYQDIVDKGHESFSNAPEATGIREILSQNLTSSLNHAPTQRHSKTKTTEKLKAPVAFKEIQTTFSQLGKKTTSPEPQPPRNTKSH